MLRGYTEMMGARNQEFNGCELGPPILRNEIEKAVRGMKWRKAEGSDGFVVEMVEAGGDFTMNEKPPTSLP